MDYALRPGLHFCDAGGRLIFLDVIADRYFCLGDQLEIAFRRLQAGETFKKLIAPDTDLLLSSGMIVAAAAGVLPTPCPPIAVPERSALDEATGQAGWMLGIAALGHLLWTKRSLRARGLAATLTSLASFKSGARLRGISVDLAAEVAAFERTGRWLRTHDQCLSRSVAIARRLLATGHPAALVIGVRLRPFAAHCWTQTRDLLVNDRIDHVRAYHPILVV